MCYEDVSQHCRSGKSLTQNSWFPAASCSGLDFEWTIELRPSRMPRDHPCTCRPVRYWACSSKQAELCYAATTGGLDRTADKGLTWALVNHTTLAADSRGSFLDSSVTPPVMYHATPAGLYRWTDGQPGTLTTVSKSLFFLEFPEERKEGRRLALEGLPMGQRSSCQVLPTQGQTSGN